MEARSKTPSRRYEHTLPGLGDKRSLPRRQHHVDVYVMPLDGRQSSTWALSADICHRGILIRSRHLYQVDSLVVLKLHTTQGVLCINAKVVHRLDGIGFGCEFLDVTDEQHHLLSFLVGTKNSAPASCRKLH